MAYRILNSEDEVEAYARELDERWPERTQIAQHICQRLNGMDAGEFRVLELCTGPGALASAILENVPVAEYVGVDISAPSLDYASRRSPHPENARWVHADLNEDSWQEQVLPGFDAIVSMQSVHDLGAEREVARIYSIARRLLRPGGRLINADLLRMDGDPPDSFPGRFTTQRNLELLHEAGFSNAQCTLRLERFGCFEALAKDGESASTA